MPGVVKDTVCHVYTEDPSVIEFELYGESISGLNCSALQPSGVGGSTRD